MGQLSAVAAASGLCVLAAPLAADEKKAIQFDFESDGIGEPPKGFEFGRTGQGRHRDRSGRFSRLSLRGSAPVSPDRGQRDHRQRLLRHEAPQAGR